MLHNDNVPDRPRPKADFVRFPPCESPKLKAFDSKGKQAIVFLEYAGQGLHAYFFEVRMKRRYLPSRWYVMRERGWGERT